MKRKHKPKLEIAKSPCLPHYSILVDGLWDCDCASNSERDTLLLALENYPNEPVLMWAHPSHYCQAPSINP